MELQWKMWNKFSSIVEHEDVPFTSHSGSFCSKKSNEKKMRKLFLLSVIRLSHFRSLSLRRVAACDLGAQKTMPENTNQTMQDKNGTPFVRPRAGKVLRVCKRNNWKQQQKEKKKDQLGDDAL